LFVGLEGQTQRLAEHVPHNIQLSRKGEVEDLPQRVVELDRGEFGLGDGFEKFERKVVYSGMTQKGDRYLCFRFNRDTCEFEYYNFVARKL
jgi:hypothetical protein